MDVAALHLKPKEIIHWLSTAGFSHEKIAYLTNVNQSTITRICKGKTLKPSYELVRSLEQLFIHLHKSRDG